jgi:hypothetical protein
MNLLTNNRILQSGDEYSDGVAWHPVPDKDFGLQIQFTKYDKVRRPSEPDDNITLTPVSPTETSQVPAAESDKDSAPSHSGAEPILCVCHTATAGNPANCPLHPMLTIKPKPKPLSETYDKAKPKAKKALPTVVSRKAHAIGGKAEEARKIRDEREAVLAKANAAGVITPERFGNEQLENIIAEILARKVAELSPSVPVAAPVPVITPHPKVHATVIPYTDLSSKPIWIGRNGTFNATGMTVTHTANGLIQIRPSGVRGLAKNALIEFPDTEIEKVVDFLLRHQPTIGPK